MYSDADSGWPNSIGSYHDNFVFNGYDEETMGDYALKSWENKFKFKFWGERGGGMLRNAPYPPPPRPPFHLPTHPHHAPTPRTHTTHPSHAPH